MSFFSYDLTTTQKAEDGSVTATMESESILEGVLSSVTAVVSTDTNKQYSAAHVRTATALGAVATHFISGRLNYKAGQRGDGPVLLPQSIVA